MERRRNHISVENKYRSRKIDTEAFVRNMETCLRSRSYKFDRRSKSPSINGSISRIEQQKSKDNIGRRLLFSKDSSPKQAFKNTKKKILNSKLGKKKYKTQDNFYNLKRSKELMKKLKDPRFSKTLNKFYQSSGKKAKTPSAKFIKLNTDTPKRRTFKSAISMKRR